MMMMIDTNKSDVCNKEDELMTHKFTNLSFPRF